MMLLRKEIQYELERSDPDFQPVSTFDSFSIDERPGEQWIKLAKKFGNKEEINLEATMFDASVPVPKLGNGIFRDLKASLIQLRVKETKAPRKCVHLLEKYFQIDNMSSAEKLKIELQKVRDEFKMSESDCGSARVQVAQLTMKINHLATALHKKDKHLRKGLQEMIHRRKKLLKYLRRTDWDSYTLVLSKLGPRDNPDYKNQTSLQFCTNIHFELEVKKKAEEEAAKAKEDELKASEETEQSSNPDLSK